MFIKKVTQIKIRNLSPEIVYLLSDEAQKRGLSREEYCRRLLLTSSVKPEIRNLDERYYALMKEITHTLQAFSELIHDLLEQAGTPAERTHDHGEQV